MSPSPRHLGVMVLALLAVVPVSVATGKSSAPPCAPAPNALTRLRGRIDSLLALRPPGQVAALVGESGGTYDARYLPHDNLVLLTAGGHRRITISLPPYTTPPGMTESPDGRTIYVVVDTMLLLIDPATGRVGARRRLDLQALGWPAAVAAGNGLIYIAGQRWTAGLPTATIEALSVGREGSPRVLWRSPLGITHAGIWLTPAGHGTLAVYVPDAHDLAGTVAILTHRSGATGTMVTSYAVNGPPAAADPTRDRLFLEGTGSVRTLSLHRGTPAAAATGSAPLALDTSRGLAAFALRDRVVVASERTLRTLALIPRRGQLQGLRALAAAPDGSTLWVAVSRGLVRVGLGACASH